MKTALPVLLETKLAQFRRRVWIVKLAEGFLAGLFGLALSWLLVFALDRFFETPGWLRLVLLLAGAATLGIGLPWKWHRWVWRQRRLEDAARLLRRTFPRLGDQLLGLVELVREDQAAAGRSERLVQAAMEQAAEAVKERDFTHAVPHPRHRQWAWAAAGALGLAVLAFVLVQAAARNALARWITPLAGVERFTFAKIEPLPAQLVVPYAEPFALPVHLSAQTEWTPAAAAGRIGYQPWIQVKFSTGVYPLSFPAQKQDAPLALRLGDVRKEILIEPRTRPELARLAVRLRLPEYLHYGSEQRLEAGGGSVSVLLGAQAAFEATASRGLVTAEMDGRPARVEGEKILTAYEPITADAERKFTWQDQDGLTPREPLVLKIHAVEDEPPRIVARRESPEQVVLDSEVVTFDLTTTDDFGVKAVGLAWVGSGEGKNVVQGEKIASAGGPEKTALAARATFCATREGVAPQTLEVRAWADDYRPGRAHALSAAFVLHVLNKTDHALWLTEQFGKWLDAAKESYEREQQLHQTNQELRALPAVELDRPENRRRVSQQAASENANAARLESLTQAGRSLVQQATKNDEFDAQRLESWAAMLKALKDIAANRMPSVADLLKQTASAPTGKTAESIGATAPPATLPTAPALDAKATPPPAAPSLTDQEKSLSQTAEPKPADPNAPAQPPSASRLGLPQTTLAAAPTGKNDEPPKPPDSAAQGKFDHALTEQKDLLAEFAKVSDQLSDILASLEASTFVKRFKAASKQQMLLASNINQKTLDAFGIEQKPVAAAELIVQRAQNQSEVVRVLQSDLDAYFQRKQDNHFKTILDEMKKTEIVRALARDGDRLAINLSGQSLIGSEFWADTLDRWAEELVAASHGGQAGRAQSGDSLPPEIVLKVMQALRDEMKLRDETREVENAKPAVDQEKFDANAKLLGEKQAGVGAQTQSAVRDIQALPEGAEKFGKELQLLTAVTGVMDEAQGILLTPETGPTAIAAETEAIELLLQTKRPSANGGGGGGSTPGGGGRAAHAMSAALAELGPGPDAESSVAVRNVGQATGRAGQDFPEEFKTGLDAYFSLLETPNAPK